jgi:hypothetical protein
VTTVTVTVSAKPALVAADLSVVAAAAEDELVVVEGLPVYGPGRSKMMEPGSQRVILGPLARLFGPSFAGVSSSVGGAVVVGRGMGDRGLGWLAMGTTVAVPFPRTMGAARVRAAKAVRPAAREERLVEYILVCFMNFVTVWLGTITGWGT